MAPKIVKKKPAAKQTMKKKPAAKQTMKKPAAAGDGGGDDHPGQWQPGQQRLAIRELFGGGVENMPGELQFNVRGTGVRGGRGGTWALASLIEVWMRQTPPAF